MTIEKCPFCGGEARIKSRYIGYGSVGLGARDWYTVECNECRAKSDEYGAELEAISAWNRRAQPDPKPLTLDELREMDGEPVMVLSDITIMRMLQNSSLEYNVGTVKLHRHMYLDVYEDVIEYSGGTCSRLDDCGRNIVAYRFKPEEVEHE